MTTNSGKLRSDLPFQDAMLELSRLAEAAAKELAPQVEAAAALVVAAMRAGGKVLACGNGGSAADAQHFVSEFVGRYVQERPSLPALSLTTDTSMLTAAGNDYGFEFVFARQVEGLGAAGDVLVGFTTSGTSPNVLRAFEAARRGGLKTVALTGAATNPEIEACDVCVHVPSEKTPRIQEIHGAVVHALCAEVERQMFPELLE